MSLLLVEQNLGLAMKVTSRAYVIHHGSPVIDGDWEHVGGAEIVKDVYLCGAQDHQNAGARRTQENERDAAMKGEA
ncbi:MAG: hypothetical protein GEU90_17625 [Gemmatimonas sp.]|nr:hypothetical protein [Gemmatimonas sp.]